MSVNGLTKTVGNSELVKAGITQAPIQRTAAAAVSSTTETSSVSTVNIQAVMEELSSSRLVGAQKDFAQAILMELRKDNENADITAADVEQFVLRTYGEYYQGN
ncbi:MAG: hypothetical protein IJ877_03650 [Candidatus Gastranaerophilales bacterium]|nr:hypothetical protein [Candidatus Gastranaerophilales bacterium]